MYDTGHTDGLWLLMIFLHKSYLWYNKDCCCCCCCFCLVSIHRVAIIQEAYATATSKEGKEDGGLNIKYFKNTDVKGICTLTISSSSLSQQSESKELEN